MGLASWVTLPLDWPDGVEGEVQLVRRFGRPPLNPIAERVELEFRSVAGLRAVCLNGVRLGPPPDDLTEWSVGLELPLAERNILTLRVDLGRIDPAISRREWGIIALTILPVLPDDS